MAVKFKPTKPNKEKAPKAPKAPKPAKISKNKETSIKFKQAKPAKKDNSTQVKIKKSTQKVKYNNSGVKIDSTTSPKRNNLNKIIILAVVLILVVTVVVVILHKKLEYDNQIARILVTKSPDKLQYYVGEELEYDGLMLQVVLNSGKSYNVDASECNFSGFNSSKAVDRQTIFVSYQGFTCTYQIMINDIPTPAKILNNIYLETPPKTEYKVGEWLNTTDGILVLEYTDGTIMRHNLTNQDVYGFVTDVETEAYVTQSVGTYTLEVRYREGGVTKTCTYTINVTE